MAGTGPRTDSDPTQDEVEAALRHRRGLNQHDRLAHIIREAARALSRGLQLRLAEHGVSFGSWVFLRILWARDGISQAELSDEAGVMAPTTHAALQRLESQGLVKRRHLPGNRKRIHVFLTEPGRALEAKLVPLAEDVNRVAVQGLAEEDVATVRRVILAIMANLIADEADALARGRRMPSTRALASRSNQNGESDDT